MVSNLPLGKLNRDELYTFMGGLFVSQVWFLYLLSNGKIDLDDSLYITLSIVLWFGSTAVIFLLNSILYFLMNKLKSEITDKDFENIEKEQYSVHVTEKIMFIHIYSVIFSSLVLVTIPTSNYLFESHFSNLWIVIFVAALVLSLIFYIYTFKEVQIITKCIKDGKCTYQ